MANSNHLPLYWILPWKKKEIQRGAVDKIVPDIYNSTIDLINNIMQPYQQTFRILVLLFFGLLTIWNLLIVVTAVFSAAWSHTPKVLWCALGVWAIAFLVALVISINTVKIDYRKKSLVILVAMIISLLPTFLFLIDSQIESYIQSWEAEHCVVSDEKVDPSFSVPDFIYICDNGDRVWVNKNEESIRRLWEGGITNTHYPYNFFY